MYEDKCCRRHVNRKLHQLKSMCSLKWNDNENSTEMFAENKNIKFSIIYKGYYL
jgi:hypothetical protein